MATSPVSADYLQPLPGLTLSGRLLLLIGLALTPPLLLGILNDVTQRNERTAALDKTAIAESRSLQDSLSLVTDGVHRLLVALAEAPSIRSGNPVLCSQYLKDVAKQMKEYTLLAVVDRDGAIVCNNEGSARGSYSVHGRAYLTRTLQTGQFASGDLVLGTVTGRWSLHFALPVTALDGSPAGIVVASVDQQWLAEQLATEAMMPGAESILLDPAGTVVAAARNGVPIKADWIGQPLPATLRAALQVTSARAVQSRGPDGRMRMYGAVPPNPSLLGSVVTVGIDRERAFSDLRAASLRNLIGLGAGALVALLAALLSARRFVLNPLARIIATADRVGAGDLNARTDLGRRSDELRELGAGFDRMITALAARERERDQAEAALRREEARLRLALEAGNLGSFELDLQTGTVTSSEAVRTMFGFREAEGQTVGDYFDRIVPEDRAQAETDLETGIATGRVVHSYRISRAGEHRSILVQAETVQDAAGNPFLIGLVADETDRLENVNALRESEARFAAIANCIDQMVWSTRPDGYHDYFNQRWYEFTGTKPGSSHGMSWFGLFHPDDHDETERIWKLSLTTGQPYHREYRLRHFSGEFRWVLGRAQAIHDEAGRIVRWYGTCTDIDDIVRAREVLAQSREALTRQVVDRTAELMAAEEQLRQSQKMEAVGQLTGGIAHDFNNMLQAIGGALELMVRRVDQNKLDDARRFAGIARTTVDRAASLTHRLLAFARRQTLSPVSVDLASLLGSVTELVSRTVGPAIEFSTEHDGEVWPVLCDLNQLENVVFNLCINARDAMPDGGKLAITARNVTLTPADVDDTEGAASGDYVEIAVADTGTGMSEATQARAFEPFFTTKPLGQGTGLGLSQVYGFVRQSGGFVRLQSALGTGTTVRLFLPRLSEAPAVSAGGEGQERTVMLVESDHAIRVPIARQLRDAGYLVRESDGDNDVMRMISGFVAPIHLLITGVGLPGNLNGRQVAEATRSRWPGLPILFLTPYVGTLVEGELDAGMTLMAAPVDVSELLGRVQSMLDQREPASA